MKSNINNMGALSNIKVLDVSHYIAGPYCTKLLAELGAEVIKVERPGKGDPLRAIGPFSHDEPHPEKSGLFLYLNMGKKSITLNLKSEAGKNLFKELAGQSDVVVENFSPRVMPQLGLDYNKLREKHLSLIMTSISNFGHTGPYKDWKATDLILCALGGISYSCYGDPEHAPLQPYGSSVQHVGGLYAAIGTMISVWHRDQSGTGQHIDISLMDCMAGLEQHSLILAAYQGIKRKRTGSRHPFSHPWGILPCKDGYVVVVTGSPIQWQRLCMLAGLPEEWGRDDSPFMDGLYRRQHADEIDASLLPWLMSHTKDELFASATELSIPLAPVKTISETINDTQHKAREFFIELDHPFTGKIKYPGFPFRMSATPCQTSRAPLVGEHNEEIYCKRLGYTHEDLVLLREQGVI
jgi:CoA:oxalate CoA-transferase